MSLSGVNFPQDGNFIYKENLDFEQNSIHSEIINRDKDSFGVGIHSGGSVSIEGLSIRISPMIAYDSLGKRIQTSESVLSSIPTGESVLVVRHSFVLSESNPDLLENAITHKSNSFEFFFRSSLLENDVALFRIRKNTIIEILEDLRSFRSINAVNIAPNSIDNSKLATDIKVGSLNSVASKILSKFSVGEVRDIVKSLNYLLAIVDEQDSSLQMTKANRSGDIFTGNISIPPAISVNHAVNKSQLDDAIYNEAYNRGQGDIGLQYNINAESLARANADNDLQSNINAESVARAYADNDLQSNINEKANKAGDTFTGAITIPSGTIDGHAVNKYQLDAHANSTSNPHSVDKSQIGLGNVANALQCINGTDRPTLILRYVLIPNGLHSRTYSEMPGYVAYAGHSVGSSSGSWNSWIAIVTPNGIAFSDVNDNRPSSDGTARIYYWANA